MLNHTLHPSHRNQLADLCYLRSATLPQLTCNPLSPSRQRMECVQLAAAFSSNPAGAPLKSAIGYRLSAIFLTAAIRPKNPDPAFPTV